MNVRWAHLVGWFFLAYWPGVSLQAWSGGGHKVVAILAYQELDPTTRKKVLALLRQHPRWLRDFERKMETGLSAEQREQWIFAQAAIWPDLARELPQYHHAKWHFINEPVFHPGSLADTPFARQIKSNRELKWNPAPNFDEELQNAPQTIDRARAALIGGALNVEKALMLSWLFHCVGDLHQPLHTVAMYTAGQFRTGDSGGNEIEIAVSRSGTNAVTLHAFWDRQLGTELRFREASDRATTIRAVPGLMAKARAQAKELSLRTWVDEGVALARSSVYTAPILAAVARADADLDDDPEVEVVLSSADYNAYQKAALSLARERVAVAGCRLAEFLKVTVK